jgi:hypothetical protein
MAAAAAPPSRRTEAAANWADPAKLVADMTSGAVHPIPAARASTPKESAKANDATLIGATARIPSA